MRPRPTRALALAALLLPRAGRCLDAEVRAETVTQGYQVRGPSGAPVLSMRRITQTLSLGASQRFDEGHGPFITLQARLRIDSDFGTACDPQTDRCLDHRSLGEHAAPRHPGVDRAERAELERGTHQRRRRGVEHLRRHAPGRALSHGVE